MINQNFVNAYSLILLIVVIVAVYYKNRTKSENNIKSYFRAYWKIFGFFIVLYIILKASSFVLNYIYARQYYDIFQ